MEEAVPLARMWDCLVELKDDVLREVEKGLVESRNDGLQETESDGLEIENDGWRKTEDGLKACAARWGTSLSSGEYCSHNTPHSGLPIY